MADLLGIVPLAWNAQAIAGSYEHARGLREVGERADGFAVTASKTVGVPVDVLFAAFVDEGQRGAGSRTPSCTSAPPPGRSPPASTGTAARRASTSRSSTRARVGRTAVVSHERLPDAAEAERMKTFWRGRVATLKEVLEG